MRKSFPSISCRAREELASRTRHDYLAGKMSKDEFLAKRRRQEIAAHNRFELLLAREFPGYKPKFSAVK